MKKLYVILITVAATLAVEAILLRSWFVRDTLLSWIEPGPEPSTCFVLTKDVVLRDHQEPIGSLRAGQKLYNPCRHDLFLTEPFDPRVLKVYVEFDGGEDARNYVALWRDMPKDFAMRDRLYLTTGRQDGSEPQGGGYSPPAARSSQPTP